MFLFIFPYFFIFFLRRLAAINILNLTFNI